MRTPLETIVASVQRRSRGFVEIAPSPTPTNTLAGWRGSGRQVGLPRGGAVGGPDSGMGVGVGGGGSGVGAGDGGAGDGHCSSRKHLAASAFGAPIRATTATAAAMAGTRYASRRVTACFETNRQTN